MIGASGAYIRLESGEQELNSLSCLRLPNYHSKELAQAGSVGPHAL